ncbi:hypothetical protein YC2023_066699 [Brassica napus]
MILRSTAGASNRLRSTTGASIQLVPYDAATSEGMIRFPFSWFYMHVNKMTKSLLPVYAQNDIACYSVDLIYVLSAHRLASDYQPAFTCDGVIVNKTQLVHLLFRCSEHRNFSRVADEKSFKGMKDDCKLATLHIPCEVKTRLSIDSLIC